jgi:hypothetical protein
MTNASRRGDSVMAVLRRMLLLSTIAGAALALASCSREITRVEEAPQQAQACFACHSDTTTFLLAAEEQWEHSQHAKAETSFETGSSCKGCHTSEGFVARAGGPAAPTVPNPTAIGCFTCHAPHSNGDFRLRWTTVTKLQTGVQFDLKAANICAACHQARRNVNTYVTEPTLLTVRWGPHHSDQADILIGSNGYQYAWYAYDQTSHRTATTAAGRDGCLECHMKKTAGILAGGHSFSMTFEEGGAEVDNTAACADCHESRDDFDIDGVQTEVDGLIGDLETRLVTAGLMTDGLPTDSVMTSRDSAGAVWNLLMAKEDRSHGVHNANYVRGLLESSIQFIMGGPGVNTTRAQRAMAARR